MVTLCESIDNHLHSSELSVVKMAPILSRPLGRLLIPSLSRAMSSGYLVHEPKYSFLKVRQCLLGPNLLKYMSQCTHSSRQLMTTTRIVTTAQ